MKKKITIRALEQRIGRCLRKENKSLHKARMTERAADSLGPYYIVDENTGSIIKPKLGPDGLVEEGKELKVLADWEEVDTEK